MSSCENDLNYLLSGLLWTSFECNWNKTPGCAAPTMIYMLNLSEHNTAILFPFLYSLQGVTLQNPFRGFDAFTHNLPHPFLLPPASLRVRPSPFPFPLLSQRFDSHPVLSLVALSSISCCKTIVNFVFWGLAVFVMLKMKLRSKMLLGIWDICYIL